MPHINRGAYFYCENLFEKMQKRTKVLNSCLTKNIYSAILRVKNECFERGVSLMTKTYRVANKLRFTVFVVLMILILTTVINFALGLNTAVSLTVPEYMDIPVVSGDTLWTIAETYMPTDTDIRKSVYELCQINDISASELYAGMTIKVPIYH